jgi:hypothetical protein
MEVNREEGLSEPAGGHSSLSSVDYVPQDAPMRPPGQGGGDDKRRKGSTFTGFLKLRSRRNKHNEKRKKPKKKKQNRLVSQAYSWKRATADAFE